jgi:hypothetical protein
MRCYWGRGQLMIFPRWLEVAGTGQGLAVAHGFGQGVLRIVDTETADNPAVSGRARYQSLRNPVLPLDHRTQIYRQ